MILQAIPFLLMVLLVSASFLLAPDIFSRPFEAFEELFEWSNITPSLYLGYTPCYSEFKCATLLVPLDWLDTTKNFTVAVAIITLPAKVYHSDPKFGGTLITNPGGPGGSGVNDLLVHGHYFQDIVDGDKNYEILSFDPRGVFHTTPGVSCFADNLARGTTYWLERGMGSLDTSQEFLRHRFAAAKAFAILCNSSLSSGYPDGSNIRAFMSTASVARDMVEIIDRLEELRLKEVSETDPVTTHQIPLAQTLETQHVAKLQYLGFSYGSYLGNTFASMFPGRIGRMILDGIVDVNDFIEAAWINNLEDTERVVEFFYKTCFQSRSCALKHSGDKEWTDARNRVNDLVQELERDPVPVIDADAYMVITADDVRAAFQIPLYAPLDFFERHADILAEALKGNYKPLIMAMDMPGLPDSCSPVDGRDLKYNWLMDTAWSVICGDGKDLTTVDLSQFSSYVEKLKVQSATLGVAWSQIRFGCLAWSIRPSFRFTGPFATPPASGLLAHEDGNPQTDRPLAPILFLSSKVDPVTPLSNAFAMSANHSGSAVLVQDSFGHCAIYSSPSNCTRRAVRKYLETGIVPENGTVCEADCKPFEDSNKAECATSRGRASLGKSPIFSI